jgi:hypothetical protein
MTYKDRQIALAAAKKSWLNRDAPNWRDQVKELLRGKQIIVKGRREWNSIYVAARRKGVRTICTKISDSEFAVVAEGKYGRKMKFIQSGNVYYAGRNELDALLNAAQKSGLALDCHRINQWMHRRVFKIVLARR